MVVFSEVLHNVLSHHNFIKWNCFHLSVVEADKVTTSTLQMCFNFGVCEPTRMKYAILKICSQLKEWVGRHFDIFIQSGLVFDSFVLPLSTSRRLHTILEHLHITYLGSHLLKVPATLLLVCGIA